MGSIDIIKPLFNVLSSAVNKSQQQQEKNSWERRESNPGLLGERQECYLWIMQPPLCGSSTEKIRQQSSFIRLRTQFVWRAGAEQIVERYRISFDSRNLGP